MSSGNADDQRDDARQDQHLDRIEPHGAQGVDLLAHLHGAELGGIGAARPARDHDGDDQHADLAQHQDADHVDHVLVGAELAEMEEALLGDDAADQERDEQNDRHRLPGDPIEMMHGRREAKGLRPPQHGDERLPERTQHVHEHDQIVPEIGNAAAEALERGEQSVLGAWRCLGLAVGPVHPFEQAR